MVGARRWERWEDIVEANRGDERFSLMLFSFPRVNQR